MEFDTPATLRVTWSWGSRVKVIFNWGDGTSDENIHPDNSRMSESSHVYAKTGVYYPNVRIVNYVKDCSDQTFEMIDENTTLQVTVLIPIENMVVQPRAISWKRDIEITLWVSFKNGTWVDLVIDWNDSISDNLYIAQVRPGDFNVRKDILPIMRFLLI